MTNRKPARPGMAEVLRRYRTAAAMSRPILAAQSGVSLTTIDLIERGQRNASPMMIRRLGAILGPAFIDESAAVIARGITEGS